MQKVLISDPSDLTEQHERNLYACALSVEKDELLNEEMKAWDITINDGLMVGDAGLEPVTPAM